MAAASDVHDSFGNCRDHKGKRTRTGASFYRVPGRGGPISSGEAQPRMFTGQTFTGSIVTSTRDSPGRSIVRRSVPPYLAPTLSAKT